MSTSSTLSNAVSQIDVKVYGNSGNVNVLAHVPASALTVLDIGCGRGDNAQHLKARGMEVDGLTISDKELTLARQFLRTGVLHNAENGLPEVITRNLYDVVICSHVIEHICYPENLLRDVRTVLKPGGVFIVALPNIMHYRSRWQLIKGNFNYQESGIWDNTHVKWYTLATAMNLLSRNGFEVVDGNVTGTIPFLSVLGKVFSSGMQKRIFNMLKGISKGFFGYELLIVSTSKKSV